MLKEAGAGILAIVTGVIGLAIVAVVLSPKAETSSVLSSGGNALSNVISAAVAPVTGNSTNAQTSMSSSNPFAAVFGGNFGI